MHNKSGPYHTLIKCIDFDWDEVEQIRKDSGLLTLNIEFGCKCNLKCRYCYTNFGLTKENELTISKIFNVIDQAVDLGVKTIVNIGGGEPLLYRYYWDLLQYEREKKLKSITFTNGTLITQDVARRLYDLRENIVLKFNSLDEDIQDYLAQRKGTGRKIRKALDHLVNVGYAAPGGPELILETVVCRQNYNEIPDIYSFCRKNNFSPYIELLTEQGEAKDNKNLLAIDTLSGFKLFKRLQKIDMEVYNIVWPLTPPIAGYTCKAMLHSVYVKSNGNVWPCPGIEVNSAESNIHNNTLSWIIKNTQVFKDVRNIYEKLKGPCRTCKHEWCYGCRGNAFQQSGDYLESDMSCWFLDVDAKI